MFVPLRPDTTHVMANTIPCLARSAYYYCYDILPPPSPLRPFLPHIHHVQTHAGQIPLRLLACSRLSVAVVAVR